MQYHLDTIPLFEAMEQPGECPLCSLHARAEAMDIESNLGERVMEPSTRINVNEHGICAHHHRLLFLQSNKLGHALLTDSHSKELLKKLEKLPIHSLRKSADAKPRLFGKNASGSIDKLASALEGFSRSCIICDTLEIHMNRYLYTFFHLWKNDAKFEQLWSASKGACMPHTALLLRHAQKHLSSSKQYIFAASAMQLLQVSLAQDEKDLEWFTLKFDYRNADKPWGNSKNALERTIGRLRGAENPGSASK